MTQEQAIDYLSRVGNTERANTHMDSVLDQGRTNTGTNSLEVSFRVELIEGTTAEHFQDTLEEMLAQETDHYTVPKIKCTHTVMRFDMGGELTLVGNKSRQECYDTIRDMLNEAGFPKDVAITLPTIDQVVKEVG